nr:MAG TPA: calcium uniporter protein [Caudoviricetes sp.]
MSYTEKELLFIEVLKKMGLDFKEGPGRITIEGIPAAQYLDEHDIFAVPEEVFIQVGFSAEEEYQEELFGDRESNLRNAA